METIARTAPKLEQNTDNQLSEPYLKIHQRDHLFISIFDTPTAPY
jgi:hypothetical protein